MTFRTLAFATVAAAAIVASFAGAQAEEADRASSPLVALQQSIGSASGSAAVVEGRQAAPVVAAPALSERDRYLIGRNAGEQH